MQTLKKTLQARGVTFLDPEDLVTFAGWPKRRGGGRISPTKAGDLACPRCGRKDLARLICKNFPGEIGCYCPDVCYIEEFDKPPKVKLVYPGVPNEFLNASFDDITQKPKDFVDVARSFAKKQHGFFLISGSPGIGKTYTGVCVMKKIVESGKDSRYITETELFQKFLVDPVRYIGILENFQDIFFLFIDDAGHKNISPGFKQFLHLLFSKRKTENLPTLIISNQGATELMDNLTPAIYSRISSGICYNLSGVDKRKRGNDEFFF